MGCGENDNTVFEDMRSELDVTENDSAVLLCSDSNARNGIVARVVNFIMTDWNRCERLKSNLKICASDEKRTNYASVKLL